MTGQIAALLMTLAAAPQDAAVDTARREEAAALAVYEAAQKKRLIAEIAADARALDAKRARLAALGGPVAPVPAASPPPAKPAEAPMTVAEVAEKTQTVVTSETSTIKDGTTVSQKTTANPFGPEGLRDGENKRKFGGIEFGVGIAYTLDTGRYQRVRDAEVVNNIVRVNRSEQSSARFVLESHYLFTPVNTRLNGQTSDFLGLSNVCEKWGEPAEKSAAHQAEEEAAAKRAYELWVAAGSKGDGPRPPKRTCETVRAQWGIGPFVALQPGTDNVIDAIGAGFMVGLRRSSKSTDSFNLGIGAMVDINAQTLGNGITEDQPLPAGDTLRFKRRSQLGLLVMSSYSF